MNFKTLPASLITEIFFAVMYLEVYLLINNGQQEVA
jgi:hypothetical protein